jgi:hypothetical protein
MSPESKSNALRPISDPLPLQNSLGKLGARPLRGLSLLLLWAAKNGFADPQDDRPPLRPHPAEQLAPERSVESR